MDSNSTSTTSDQEAQQLREQLRNCLAELVITREALDRYQRRMTFVNRVIGYTTYGPGLTSALERWERAFEASKKTLPWRRIPQHESLAVIGAYLKRRALAGLLIASLAAVPGTLTVALLFQQNKKIDQQLYLTGMAQASQLQSTLADTIAAIYQSPEEMCLSDTKRLSRDIENHLGYLHHRLAAVLFHSKCWNNMLAGGDNAPVQDSNAWIKLFVNSAPAAATSILSDEYATMSLAKGGFDRTEHPIEIESLTPPMRVHARAASLSTALRPYRTLRPSKGADEPPVLSDDEASPERGVLLRAYADNGFSPSGLTLEKTWAPEANLERVNWHNVSLAGSMLECSFMSEGDFTGTELRNVRAAGASFRGSNLANASAHGADLRHADFRQAILPSAASFQGARVANALFIDAVVPEVDWLRIVAGEDAARYEYEPIKVTGLNSAYRMKMVGGYSHIERGTFCRDRRALAFQ